jgi:N-acetylglucosamine-6-sulfatase
MATRETHHVVMGRRLDKRIFVLSGSILLLFGLGAAESVTAGAESVQQRARPNVLVIMTDDQTVESLRVMGNVKALLADQGTTFDSSFATFSLCCPSRATFLTGEYAHNHGVMGNAPPAGGYARLDSSNTLPVWLQRAGYHTVHIGKYLNGYPGANRTHVPPGWTEWYGSIDPSTYRFYNYTLNENGRLVTYGRDPASYQADVYSRKAVDAVRRLAPGAAPFFLSVAFLAPHSGGPREPDDPRGIGTPVPAPRHRNRYAAEPLPQTAAFNEADVSDKPAGIRSRPLLSAQQIANVTENYRQRLESLLAVDDAVAGLVAALRETRELERTLIVFTSDNGFFHGEHRVLAGKVLLYEPSIRVPLILRGPGVPRGQHVVELVANVDVAPTIVDAAGARALRVMDGRSLLPLARDAGRRTGRDILIERGPGGNNQQVFTALRTARYLYAEYSNGDRELYDLVRDPEQLTSLHADPAHQALQGRLAERLARLRSCTGAACRSAPRLGVRVAYRFKKRARCPGSRVRALVAGVDAASIERVDFFIRGRRVARDRAAPYRVVFAGHRFRTARVLRVRAVLDDGRMLTLERAVRRCK